MSDCASTMSFLFVISMGFLCSSHAHNHIFYVGENDGWTLKPLESYSHWAERHRFKINDELVFKYKKGNDSVLVVRQGDYYKCNKDNPIKTLKNGHSRFKFDRSGPFFFISGHDQNCEKGQKFIVVVLSNHHHNHDNPPSQPPETARKPPFSSPSPSPTVPPVNPLSHSPSPSPSTYHHSPPVEPPSHSQSPFPGAAAPLHRIEPDSHSPSPSPAAAKTPANAPPVQPHSHSPPPSSRKEAPVPSELYALLPHAHPPLFPPHHAPAPAPSSASNSGGSYILLMGFSLVATVISAGLV